MTHNIQFGVNIDDESIQRGVEKATIEEIQRTMFGQIRRSSWGNPTFTTEFRNSFLEGYFDKIFENPEVRAELIKATAEHLAERLARSQSFIKKVVEAVDKG